MMSRRCGKGFWLNESGATAALYALALPALVAVAGVGFDYARLAGLDSELQNAADQAALAAVTQLDGNDAASSPSGVGACARAANAASGLVSNSTLLANDGGGLAVAVASETACDATGVVRFWQNEAATTAATSDANANFVEIVLGTRRANYALTPIVGAFGGDITAAALAGLGGAICGTAALSYCNPSLPADFDPDAYEGRGILVGTMSGSGTWGYLKVPPSNNANGVEEVLAQDRPAIECRAAASAPIALPGSATGLVRAINTRFDIFDNNIVNNNQPCENIEDCAPAANVVKDVVRDSGNSWVLPENPFWPAARSGAYSPSASYDADGLIDSMGLPRDLCHYGSYGYDCGYENGLGNSANDIGSGNWARAEYFNEYHPTRTPTGYESMTRYQTYLWELANNGYLSDLNGISGGTAGTQYSQPVNVAASTSAYDRRVVTVAFSRGDGTSCPGANDPVPVLEWVDMFFVQPGASQRHNYPSDINENSSDPIYMEIIGRSSSGSTGPQITRRDIPYLVR
jgi:Flp pilus assembly protein TadG